MIEVAQEQRHERHEERLDSTYMESRKAPQKLDEYQIYELIKNIQEGNTDLFELIVEQYQGEIFKVAWQITRNFDDASDVLQETFLRVYRALSSWTGKAKFSTWLYRIAVNATLDYLRRQKKHYTKRLYVEEIDEESRELKQQLEGVEYQTPREILQAKRQREMILRLMAKISPMQRKCFMLHFFQELSLKEISAITRCSIGAVKRHIFRARERLRLLVKDLES